MKSVVLLIAIVVTCSVSSAQVINTLAGIGPLGPFGSFSGDGGPAVLAGINRPFGIEVDRAGNVYISDESNNRIRKLNTAGIITTICGNGMGANTGDGGPASAAEIQPTSITTDKTGNLYIACGARVRKIDTAGIITLFAGTGTPGYSGDGGPATAAMLALVLYVAADDTGNVYVGMSNCVRKVNTAGIITLFAGDTTGVLGFSGDGGPATVAEFNTVQGIAADKAGNVYIVDQENYRVRKVNPAGIVTTIAGTGIMGYSGDGGPATAAKLGVEKGLRTDTAGNLYIADYINSVIRKVDTAGIISTVAGNDTEGYSGDGGPATAAELARPYDVAVAQNGIIYISDNWENRIRVISFNLYFAHGKYQTATICPGNTLLLDTLLGTIDSNVGVAEYWMPLSGPYHGTALATYTTTTTGGAVYPAGLTYTPAPGFSGIDTLTVRITDSIISDTTTIYITIAPQPNAGAISGLDSVCIGDSILLSDTTSGGTWKLSNANATVAAGRVIAVTAGTDTVWYMVTNMCGTDTVSHIIFVRLCPSSVTTINPKDEITIYPNPANNELTIESGDKITNVTITNLFGQKVYTHEFNATQIQLNITTLPPGMYFVKVNNTYVRKILKE